MKITNRANLPDSLVRAVRNDPYQAGSGDISCTQLIAPPQLRILRKRHEDELEEDVLDRIWSLLGQAVHTILERAGELGLREQRLYMPVGGWLLSGQFDRLVFTPEGVLQDYKVTSTWSALKPKAEWEAQLNVLADLCRYNGHDVRKLEIVAIFRDWSYRQAQRGHLYPQEMASVLPITLWEPAITQRYIEERIALHRRAEAGSIAPCTDDERWYRNEGWAVTKAGRASALRLLPSETEALAWATANDYAKADGTLKAGITLVQRPGEYIRCERYCPVATVCPQWAVRLQEKE